MAGNIKKKRLTEKEKSERKELNRKVKQQRLLERVKHEYSEVEMKKKIKPYGNVAEDITLSTTSIAVPGSIMDNAQSHELQAYLAGQIARAACIFQIDEIVVFDDYGSGNELVDNAGKHESSDGAAGTRRGCIRLARILQYLECPQYLRKYFFPIHNDLKFCGLLNPLDSQHHLRQQSIFHFREGIVTNKPVKAGNGSYVNVGLANEIKIKTMLEPNLRVTVKLPKDINLKAKNIVGEAVSPSRPRLETGIYWGYNVRIANSISQVITKSPYKGGYDLLIGTSDNGRNIRELGNNSLKFKHCLIVFGGILGLEPALENDPKMKVESAEDIFDEYLNTIPMQGSRTIRTEEAILISLTALGEKLAPSNPSQPFTCFDAIPNSQDTGIHQYAFNEHRSKTSVVTMLTDNQRLDTS